MKRSIFLLLSFLGMAVAYSQSPRTSWPMINGDAMRSSFASMNMSLPLHVTDTLLVSYRRENGTALWDNKLFLADYALDSNRLLVADAITGDSLWSFAIPYSGGGMEFIPAVSDGIVLIGGQGGRGLYALDAMNGDSLWFLPIRSLYTRSPVIRDSRVYICASDSLVCADLHTGQVFWSIIGPTRQISPVVDGQNVYTCGHDFLYAADTSTGDTLWVNHSVEVGDFLSLSLDSQYLYTGFLRTISALDKSTGEVAWSAELDTTQKLEDFPGSFALTKDYLLVKYLENGNLYDQFLLLDKSTGEEINRYPGALMNYGSPTVINDYVVEYFSGELLLLNILTGEVAFEMSVLPLNGYATQVIAANDKIYIAGTGHYVFVLEGSTAAVHDPEMEPVSLLVFPNPVRDQINISFTLSQGSRVSLEVLTAAGISVIRNDLGDCTSGEHQLAVPSDDLVPGLYYVRLETAYGDVVRKVIKEKN